MQRTRPRSAEFRQKFVQGVDKAPAAEGIERHEDRRPAMLQRPGQLSRCRERTDGGDDRPDLGGGKRSDKPFRPIGDQQSNAIAVTNAQGQQRTAVLALYTRKHHGPNRGPDIRSRTALLRAAWRFVRGSGAIPRMHAWLPETNFEAVEHPEK